MLDQIFTEVYSKFKLQFYNKIFCRFQDRQSSLSAVETFCVEAIHALNRPTVNEFATFTQISAPNAAYKINCLIKKGYVKKVQSSKDKREYYLEVTGKFYEYYDINYDYVKLVMDRIKDKFSKEDIEKFESILTTISNDLMPEVIIPRTKENQE